MASHVHQLERRLFRHHWDDGLLDVLSGVGLLGLGVCWTVDLISLGAIVPAMLAPFWAPLRRTLVEPRAGLVEFTDERVGQNRRWLTGSALLGVMVLAVSVVLALRTAPDPTDLLPTIAPALPALLIGLLALIASLMLGLPRFMLSAALIGTGGLVVAVTDSRPEAAMIAGGLLVLSSGAWRFVRFLRLDAESVKAD